MLSRLSLYRRPNLVEYVCKFRTSFITTSAKAASGNIVKKDNVSSSNIPDEYPPPSSKRDFVNYPKMVRREDIPPVRLVFLPESWFDFVYPKTGYTGPYVLLAFGLVYLLSKELIVINTYGSIIVALAIWRYGTGDVFYNYLMSQIKKDEDALDAFQDGEINSIKDEIKYLQGLENMKTAVAEVTKGRTEVIYLQMENAFRDRIMQIFKEVKSKLDCQSQLEAVERRIIQKNLMDYVLRNVMSSITPDLEKNVLQACINDLNALSARTSV